MIPEKHRNRYFYHFTHMNNLDSILKNGFLSTNKKNNSGINHTNIANEVIQNRRHNMDVTCGPEGKVHDYVPFYFTTINPMLLGIVSCKNIDQPFIIFFAVSIEKLLENNVVFTDASANTNIPPNFYDDAKDLNKLNWDLIDSNKWKFNDDERHRKMAEVLVYDEVPLDWIDTIIVWNEEVKKFVEQIYKKNKLKIPNITDGSFNDRYFYYTKFFFPNRRNESLITGPVILKHEFENLIEKIVKNRKNKKLNFKFKNIAETIQKIENNFCCIEELKGIYKLETDNKVHSENVSEHTKSVVKNLIENDYYNDLSKQDKDIVKLSAYLHDIGKGPKSKWKDGKQKLYLDHPADAIPMLERILSEDILELSKYEIRKICLLVVYHDLIGDIIGKDRSIKELKILIKDEKELNMLIAISMADVSSINKLWLFNIKNNISILKQKILEYLND